jgi:hypothetical protein
MTLVDGNKKLLQLEIFSISGNSLTINSQPQQLLIVAQSVDGTCANVNKLL